VIHDADDAGVDRGLGGIKRKARLFAAHEEDLFAHTCADGVHCNERPADRRPIG